MLSDYNTENMEKWPLIVSLCKGFRFISRSLKQPQLVKMRRLLVIKTLLALAYEFISGSKPWNWITVPISKEFYHLFEVGFSDFRC